MLNSCSAIGPALSLAQLPFSLTQAFHELNLLTISWMHASTRDDGRYEKAPLLTANFWFMSAHHGGGCKANTVTLRCFLTLWPVLCAVAPQLRSCISHLTLQDVDDLLFSLSREYARRVVSFEAVL
jgi:hypothetical protein